MKHASEAVVSLITVGTTSAVLVPERVGRVGFIIHNRSANVLYIRLGSNCTTTNFSIRINANTQYDLVRDRFNYVGVISGIGSSANTFVHITELIDAGITS